MPLYEFECPNGHKFDHYASLKQFRRHRKCKTCGKRAGLVVSVLAGYVQRECIYDSPIDGRPVTSWRQRRDDLARNHCQEYDPGMKQDADRYRRQRDASLDKSVDEFVEKSIHQMPSRKREMLIRELDAGTDVEITRSGT